MSNPIAELKQELLGAAQRQYAAVPARRGTFGGRVVDMRPLLVAATVAVAGAAALFVTVPWRSSPSFLAQAEAALIPPEGTILHLKVAETTRPEGTNPYCTSVTRIAEIWVDARTHSYRGLFHDPFSPYPFRFFEPGEFEKVACSRGTRYEVGGAFPPGYLTSGCCYRSAEFRFVPPNRLVTLSGGGLGTTVQTLDPVADLRRAIRLGRAHDEGMTKLRGRVVERIRLDPCDPGPKCPELEDSGLGGGYAYVDPETFYPIEIRQARDVTRFDVFEYLPRTATNVALASIRAQHPNAIGP